MFYVILYSVIGVLHGLAFNWLFKDREVSQTANIVLGMIGAITGGVAAASYGPYDFGTLGEILIAATGALVFLTIGNLLELAFNKHRIQ